MWNYLNLVGASLSAYLLYWLPSDGWVMIGAKIGLVSYIVLAFLHFLDTIKALKSKNRMIAIGLFIGMLLVSPVEVSASESTDSSQTKQKESPMVVCKEVASNARIVMTHRFMNNDIVKDIDELADSKPESLEGVMVRQAYTKNYLGEWETYKQYYQKHILNFKNKWFTSCLRTMSE